MNEDKLVNVHERLANVNMALFGMQITKSGHNKHKGFRYHELWDIIPPVSKLCYEQRLSLEFPYSDDVAILRIFNLDNPKDYIVYRLTFPELIVEEKNPNNNLIQAYGADITYLQRYLLKLAFPALSDKDVIDSDEPSVDASSACKKNTKKEPSEKVNADIPQLYEDALKELRTVKGLNDSVITPSAIRKHIFKNGTFNRTERDEIARYVKTTWRPSK